MTGAACPDVASSWRAAAREPSARSSWLLESSAGHYTAITRGGCQVIGGARAATDEGRPVGRVAEADAVTRPASGQRHPAPARHAQHPEAPQVLDDPGNGVEADARLSGHVTDGEAIGRRGLQEPVEGAQRAAAVGPRAWEPLLVELDPGLHTGQRHGAHPPPVARIAPPAGRLGWSKCMPVGTARYYPGSRPATGQMSTTSSTETEHGLTRPSELAHAGSGPDASLRGC